MSVRHDDEVVGLQCLLVRRVRYAFGGVFVSLAKPRDEVIYDLVIYHFIIYLVI